MKGKVKITNKETIRALLAMVEKRCRERTFDQERLENGVEKAESKLKQLGIPKKYWQGCFLFFKPEMVPNSYKGIAYGTEVAIRRGSKDWFIYYADRVETGNQSYGKGEREVLFLCEKAKEAIPNTYEV